MICEKCENRNNPIGTCCNVFKIRGGKGVFDYKWLFGDVYRNAIFYPEKCKELKENLKRDFFREKINQFKLYDTSNSKIAMDSWEDGEWTHINGILYWVDNGKICYPIIGHEEFKKPISIKLYSLRQEDSWGTKEIPSTQTWFKKSGGDLSYDDNGNCSYKNSDLESRDFRSFNEIPAYEKPPKTRRNEDLIEKYNNRFWKCFSKADYSKHETFPFYPYGLKSNLIGDIYSYDVHKKGEIKDLQKAYRISKALAKIHWLFCNRSWLIENAVSRHKQYGTYGKHTHKWNSITQTYNGVPCQFKTVYIGNFLSRAESRAIAFLYKHKTPFSPAVETWTNSNIFEILDTIKKPLQRKAVIECVAFDRKCTDIGDELGTTHQNISKLAKRGLENLRKKKSLIWLKKQKIKIEDVSQIQKGVNLKPRLTIENPYIVACLNKSGVPTSCATPAELKHEKYFEELRKQKGGFTNYDGWA